MRWLIVNADDFGASPGVTRGIVEAHRRGVVTSTSLMVHRAAAQEAAALARDAPELSVGLHLELDGDAAEDAGAAVAEQLERFELLVGGPPTHLDSHHDVHRRDPGLLHDVLASAQRLGIPLRGHSGIACITSFYGQWGGETHLEQVSVESAVAMLEAHVEDGVTELVCHPGHVDAQLVSSYAAPREAELETLCDGRVRQALRRAGISLVSFRDAAALLGGGPEVRSAWRP